MNTFLKILIILCSVQNFSYARVQSKFSITNVSCPSINEYMFVRGETTQSTFSFTTGSSDFVANQYLILGDSPGVSSVTFDEIFLSCTSVANVRDPGGQGALIPLSEFKEEVSVTYATPPTGMSIQHQYNNVGWKNFSPGGFVTMYNYGGAPGINSEKRPFGYRPVITIDPNKFTGGSSTSYTVTHRLTLRNGTKGGADATFTTTFRITIKIPYKSQSTCGSFEGDKGTINLPPIKDTDLESGKLVNVGSFNFALTCPVGLEVYVKLYDVNASSGKDYLSTYYDGDKSAASNYVLQVTDNSKKTVYINNRNLSTSTTNSVKVRTDTQTNARVTGSFNIGYIKRNISSAATKPGKIQADMIMQYLYF